MKEITREQAIALHDTRFWEGMSARDIATFQLHEDKLCMPFDVFHLALEEALGRPVWTHELGMNRDGIMRELAGDAEPPSMEDIINLIPEEKRIIVSS